MKVKKNLFSLFLLFLVGGFVLAPGADAATPIASISAFDGEVSILSDYKIVKVTRAGQVLKQGDRVQVKVGFAAVTFNDGATLNVNPYSSALIQEQEEETGFWIFKVKKTVRRITCFIGKLKFKSGKSIQDNYLQTPTAVAGLRGTEAEVGFDNVNNYLNMISGELAATYGDFIRGFFENPGVDAATKNQVFQALEKAKDTAETGNQQAAQVAALEVIQTAAQEMTKNPDPNVAKQAQDVVNQTQQQIDDAKKGIEPTPTTLAPTPTTVQTPIITFTEKTTTSTTSSTLYTK
ncbi:MAG: hypothetical protein P1P89_19430 [Desulfobacterales bacterium]|nr:hypothetical protein [Desulfobacterales bacterium]